MVINPYFLYLTGVAHFVESVVLEHPHIVVLNSRTDTRALVSVSINNVAEVLYGEIFLLAASLGIVVAEEPLGADFLHYLVLNHAMGSLLKVSLELFGLLNRIVPPVAIATDGAYLVHVFVSSRHNRVFVQNGDLHRNRVGYSLFIGFLRSCRQALHGERADLLVELILLVRCDDAPPDCCGFLILHTESLKESVECLVFVGNRIRHGADIIRFGKVRGTAETNLV